MKTLFITRKYPPNKGGMEKISYGIISNFPELENARIISWGRSQKGLIFFIPWVFLKSFYLLSFKQIDIIHLGDCALAFIGYILKRVFKTPIVITAHGLDLTYNNKLYQFMIKKTLKYFDKIICVSTATRGIAISKGLEQHKCVIIYNGIDTSELHMLGDNKSLRKKLEEKTKLNLSSKFVLLSVGRLVKRKGVSWFIKNVFTKLDNNCIFLIIGRGEEEKRIRGIIKSLQLENRIFMLGKVSDETLKLAYNSADIFIMPNIPIAGDMEGFGIVAIEAASCGLPVIASNLEGIKEAVREGQNGFLVEPYDIKSYVKKITGVIKMKNLKSFKKKQMEYTKENYDIKNISHKYHSLFKKILEQ